MRFDDSLNTVLSAEMDSGFGAQSAWRQLVDLMGRRRIAVDQPAIARLRALRDVVPDEVRIASARVLASAAPSAELVALFADDVFAVAAPVLRAAILEPQDWVALLPGLTPQGRALLRHRRDLPASVVRALEGYGAADFVLHHDGDVAAPAAAVTTPPADASAIHPPMPMLDELRPAPQGGYQIADLVARIDAFRRHRDPAVPPSPVVTAIVGEPSSSTPAGRFRFETDAAGMICAVDGVARGALIGASLRYGAPQGLVRVDAVITGAFRQRQRFADARLDVGGGSDAAGSWRVAGTPVFEPASGRFTGYVAEARRPRSDEEPGRASRKVASDSLRQLVHELRTPATAIAGFAELIEAQLLGPVSPVYREHALTIRDQATQLLGAIEDLDTAARIEGGALELRPASVPIEPLLARIAQELEPLATLRRTALAIHPMGDHAALTDDRAVERLLSRLLAALTSAAAPGERIDIAEAPAPDGQVALCFGRPQALGTGGEEALLSIDGDIDHDDDGAPLLGAGFALRLARNLARELGGELIFGDDLLTLRLPAANDDTMEQAAN